ncbi:LysE family translocator [Streptomyces sp. NPDC005303]|uniref:LysE family translocator n=1 Tax=Streptomyces sp. NPDC005303 TaxID=3155713 RepID=UPI0033A28DC8
MVSTDRVLAFAAMSLLVIVIPGPSVLFVIGRALAHGRRTAVATAIGNVLGSCPLVVAVAVGIGSLVERSAAVYLAVKLAGAAYLVLLGVQAFRHRGELKASAITSPSAGPARGDLRTVLDSALVGVTNPKGIVFFAAVLPQFVDHAAGRVPAQMHCSGGHFPTTVPNRMSYGVPGCSVASIRSPSAVTSSRCALVRRSKGSTTRASAVSFQTPARKPSTRRVQ